MLLRSVSSGHTLRRASRAFERSGGIYSNDMGEAPRAYRALQTPYFLRLRHHVRQARLARSQRSNLLRSCRNLGSLHFVIEFERAAEPAVPGSKLRPYGSSPFVTLTWRVPRRVQ